MKLAELLLEVPLPSDWDKEVMTPKTSFKKRIDYAVQKAAKMGSGSSRVAFIIPYEGRDTILKVAKNAKGMAQNEYEASMLSDYLLKDMGIIIPMIDYDEEHNQPVWIHTEKSTKVTPTIFKKYFGTDPFNLVQIAKHMTGKKVYVNAEGFEELVENNENVSNFVDFIGNWDVPPDDFGRLANWGAYNGKLVIIDVGLSHGIFKQYYGR